MALVEVPPSLELPDAAALTPAGEQCPAGPVASTAVAGAITVGDQVAMKVNDQIRLRRV